LPGEPSGDGPPPRNPTSTSQIVSPIAKSQAIDKGAARKYPIGYPDRVEVDFAALRSFVDCVVRAPTERAIATAFMDSASELFGAPMLGYYALGSRDTAEIHTRGVGDTFVDDYERMGRANDPLLRRVAASRAPASATVARLCDAGGSYAEFVRSHGYVCGEYLLAPIVVAGRLVGTLNCARRHGAPFAESDWRTAAAVSLEVSTRTAVLRTLETAESAWDGALSTREIEVAALAVRGLSTCEVGRLLGVSSNTVKKHLKSLYAKLGVGSRVELSTAFARGPSSLQRVPRGCRPTLPLERRAYGGATAFGW
jgi:DNA-binding CsgD family transcriptional regulator